MPKKGRNGHFRYKQVPQGIRFYLRNLEAFSFKTMLNNYLVDATSLNGMLTVGQRIVLWVNAEVCKKVTSLYNEDSDTITITLTKAQALAIHSQISARNIIAENTYDVVLLNNINTAIDKTIL